MIKDKDIVCVSWLDWDCIPLVMHHMMKRLSENNRVLWVDPPFPLTSFISRPLSIFSHATKVKKWLKGVQKVSDNFWVYYPPPLLLFYGRMQLNDRFSQILLAGVLKKLLAGLHFSSPIMWLYHPYAILPAGEFNEKLVCYDCNDDIGSFFCRLPYHRKRLSELEKNLLQTADVVFTTSKSLFQNKKVHNDNTYYLPSGADIDIFSKAKLPETVPAADLTRIKKPIIGFVGGMDNTKMSWDWIEKAAAVHPEWSFVFLGPVQPPLPKNITGKANIHFIGKRNMEELPHYIKGFDICLIPYKESDFMKSCFPTKTFEYLAGGKPVVTTDIPALRDYRSTVKLSTNSGQFIDNIQQALAEKDDPALIKQRCELASDQTWDARLEKTSAIIEKLL